MPWPSCRRVQGAFSLVLAYSSVIVNVGTLLLVVFMSIGFQFEILLSQFMRVLRVGRPRDFVGFLDVTFSLVAVNCAQLILFIILIPLIALPCFGRWIARGSGLPNKRGSMSYLNLRLFNTALLAGCLCLAWITLGTALYWLRYRRT